MAENLGRAVLEVDVDTAKLTKGLDRAEEEGKKKTKGVSTALATGLATAGAAAAAAMVTAFATGVAEAGLEVEEAFAEVKTLLPGISDEVMAELEADMFEFSKQLNIPIEEGIPALYQAISAGIPAENVFTFMEAAAKVAHGGVTSVKTAVDGLSTVVNAWKEDEITAEEAADQMFTAIRLGKTDAEQMSTNISNVASSAASAGISFGETAAQMALLTSNGIPTNQATTKLRSLFDEAKDSSSDLGKAINDVHGKSFRDLVAEGKPVHEILEDVRQSMPDEEFEQLFSSVEAREGALNITGQNFEKMSENLDAMENSAGAADEAFETMSNTARYKVNSWINVVKTTMADWGNTIMPALVTAIETTLIPVFTKLSDWWNENKETIQEFFPKVWAKLEPIITPWKEAIQTIIDIIKELLAPLQGEGSDAIQSFFQKAKDVATPIITTITEKIQTIVDKFVAIADWINENPDTIKAWIQGVLDGIDPIITSIKTILESLGNVFSGLVEWFSEENSATVTGWWEGLKASFTTYLAALQTLLEEALKLLAPAWEGIVAGVESIATWFTENEDTIQGFFETVWKIIEPVIGFIVAAIKLIYDALAAIATWIVENKETIQGFFDTVWSVIEPVIGFIVAAITGIYDAVAKIVTWIVENREEIQGWFQAVWDTIQTVIESITTAITGIYDAFVKIADWITEQKESVQNWFQAVWDAIQSTIESITTAITGIYDAFVKIADWVVEKKEAVQNWFQGVWDAIQSTIESIKTGITGVYDTFVTISDWITENKETIQNFIQGVWDTISPVVEEIKTGLGGIYTALDETAAWITGFPTVLSTAWEGLPETLGGVWDLVRDRLTTAWKEIVQIFFPGSGEEGGGAESEEEAAGLVANIQESWAVLDTWFFDLWTDVTARFQEFWDGVLAIFGLSKDGEEQEGEGLHNIIDTVWRPLENTVSDIFTNVKAKIQAAWDAILELLGISKEGEGLGTDLATLLTSAWTTIEGTVETIWTNVTTKITTAWTNILGVLGFSAEGIPNGSDLNSLIENVWGTVKETVGAIWDDVTEEVRDAWNEIIRILFPSGEGESLGARLLVGWWGIVDAVGAIFTSLMNIVRDTINLLIDALNSPLEKWNELSFDVPGWSKSFGGQKVAGVKIPSVTVGWEGISIETPDVPLVPPIKKLAEGGLIDGATLALIGEAGPEVVIPLDQLDLMNGGPSTQVVFQGPVYGMDDFQRKVNEALLLSNRRGKENLF